MIYFITNHGNEWGPKRVPIETRRDSKGEYGNRVVAYHHFSGDELAGCEGCGYDLEGTALAGAVASLFRGLPETDGAIGVPHVQAFYAERGVTIRDISEALWALPERKEDK